MEKYKLILLILFYFILHKKASVLVIIFIFLHIPTLIYVQFDEEYQTDIVSPYISADIGHEKTYSFLCEILMTATVTSSVFF